MLRTLLLLLISCTLLASPPKAVVFDYGGVIATVDRKPLLKYLSQTLDLPYKKVKKDFAADTLYQSLQQPIAFWENYVGHSLPKSWYKTFEEKKSKVVQDISGMKEVVLQLKEQGIQVVLLSNTTTARARFIEIQGGYDLFDPILLSCHLGVGKPHPKIFEKLLSYIPYQAEECLFIDNRKKNIRAGKRRGLDGILFVSTDQLKEALKKREILLE